MPDLHKPFVGAQPKLLKMPKIASEDETYKATQAAIQAVEKAVKGAEGVLIVLAQAP